MSQRVVGSLTCSAILAASACQKRAKWCDAANPAASIARANSSNVRSSPTSSVRPVAIDAVRRLDPDVAAPACAECLRELRARALVDLVGGRLVAVRHHGVADARSDIPD